MKFEELSIKKIATLVFILTLIVMGIWQIGTIWKWVIVGLGVLTPFLIGGGIAFVMNVPMRFIEEKLFVKIKNARFKRFERPLSLFLSFLIVFTTLTLVVSIVIPQIVTVVGLFAENVPYYLSKLVNLTRELIRTHPWVNNLISEDTAKLLTSEKDLQAKVVSFLDPNKIQAFLLTITTTIGATFGFVSNVFGQVANTLIGLFFAIYILANKEELHRQLNKGVYAFLGRKQAVYTVHVGQVAYAKFYSFITGQMAEAIILGALCFVGMKLFAFPYAPMISVLIGFANLIPIAGALIAGAVGSLLILSVDPMKGLLFLVFLIVLQQLEGNIIYPRVVGGSVGLPALWTLVAITLGGTLMGLLGMLTFVPLGATIYTIFTEIVNARLNIKGIAEDSPELLTGLPESVKPHQQKTEKS